MSSIKKNIKIGIKVNKSVKIGIVKSVYNSEITDALYSSCKHELIKGGVLEKNIQTMEVPGAFELPFGCKKMAKSEKIDAIIALGAIIKGETPHFDIIANACAKGIMKISIKSGTPIVFGVLTTNNLAQAKARIKGGKRGDKGVEAALTALHMSIL
ncbi:6,7-dimethyl-8-ribityllumazine synthase [Candidatus Peregrinibacteria bacterium]|nr:6,7-dimethyl-8-ribityllumazine synthase [Candidatus Peregrinibacteria bacterium]